jgi:hypothetical protein
MEDLGEECPAIFVPFPRPDHKDLSIKIEIFDPEGETFTEPYTGGVNERGHGSIHVPHATEKGSDLFPRQNLRQPARLLRPDSPVEILHRLSQDLSIEKDKGVERPILSGRGRSAVYGQIGEEIDDIGIPKIFRRFSVEENPKPCYPTRYAFSVGHERRISRIRRVKRFRVEFQSPTAASPALLPATESSSAEAIGDSPLARKYRKCRTESIAWSTCQLS